MAKKSSGKGGSGAKTKPKAAMTADTHRKMERMHHAKARLHGAKADMADALNPPKKSSRIIGY